MSTNKGHIKEELDTVTYMIQFYCGKHHHTKKKLCTECQDLLDYASQQLLHCQFGKKNPFVPNVEFIAIAQICDQGSVL